MNVKDEIREVVLKDDTGLIKDNKVYVVDRVLSAKEIDAIKKRLLKKGPKSI